MKTTLRCAGTILLSILLVLGMGAGGGTAIAEENTTLSVTYTFVGDEAEKAGFAQGEITITPGEGALSSGYYLVYYADDTDTLKGYDELASVKITGSTVTHTVKDGTMIPVGATQIAVFESETRFQDETPPIADASAVADIPTSKQLTLGTPEMTFGAVSDVHMNYEGYHRGAYQKWGNALNFFAEKNMDYLIVTGDMTGDVTLDLEYEIYNNIINESKFPIENVYESIGNHGNTPSDIGMFTQYTSGEGEDHPYEGSPYYSVLIKGKTSKARDNLFIFMAQELKAPGDSAAYDNFSEAQIDWLEGLLNKYGNTGTNIFIIEHSPFLNFGPGDRHPGGYTALVTFKEEYTQTMRLKSLLETYKDAIVMSGHTHLTLYDTENYSDEYNSFARMVHVGSTCYPNGYGEGKVFTRGTDGRYEVSETYGSEVYLVSVYSDYIVYTGYNLSTGKIIPGGCLLLPVEAYGGPGKPEDPVLDPDKVFEGAGTAEDPYLISDAEDFKALTDGFNASISSTESEMYGYGKYFEQTADIDMSNVSGYAGTTANGNAKCFFAGTYNGGGYTIKVDIDDSDQRSVFPYVYGTLYNVVIKGSIKGEESAQPVRTLYGSIINCEFDMTLSANRAHGLLYSNYGYVYNVYTHGTLSGNYPDAVSAGTSSVNFVQLYHYYNSELGEEITDSYGTRSNDLEMIAQAFNDRSSEQYQNAQKVLETGAMSTVSVQNDALVFSHPVSEPPSSSEEPSTSSEEPSTSSEEPSTSSEEPSTSSEEPSTSSEAPSASEEPSSQASSTSSTVSQVKTGETVVPVLAVVALAVVSASAVIVSKKRK